MIIFTGRCEKPFLKGVLILILLIPGSLIDESNKVGFSGIISNLLGPISMALFLIVLGRYKLKYNEFDSILRLIWYASNKGNFTHRPDRFYLNKQICVSGVITQYRGIPQIQIDFEEQIEIQ